MNIRLRKRVRAKCSPHCCSSKLKCRITNSNNKTTNPLASSVKRGERKSAYTVKIHRRALPFSKSTLLAKNYHGPPDYDIVQKKKPTKKNTFRKWVHWSQTNKRILWNSPLSCEIKLRQKKRTRERERDWKNFIYANMQIDLTIVLVCCCCWCRNCFEDSAHFRCTMFLKALVSAANGGPYFVHFSLVGEDFFGIRLVFCWFAYYVHGFVIKWIAMRFKWNLPDDQWMFCPCAPRVCFFSLAMLQRDAIVVRCVQLLLMVFRDKNQPVIRIYVHWN